MEIRGVIKPRKGSSTTVARAGVSVAAAVTPVGVPRVTCFVRSKDHHDIESMFGVLHLSPTEAREIAARFVACAAQAEADAAAQVSK